MNQTLKNFFASFLLMAMASFAFADGGKASLSGKVVDQATGSTIPGAEVYFPDLHTGAVTNMDGHYEVKELPAAKALVKVAMMGYATHTEIIDLATVSTRDFALTGSVTEMSEVVVTGTAKATELKRDPVPITLVGRQFLRENASFNAIGALALMPGISAVTTGPNVAKPYIRGLGGNRVLTLFDGIRQEGQQWGEEHGVEVDQFLVDRVEVVKGPASLMYGSDALAGVVNLIPAPPVPAGTISGSALLDHASNNKAISASVNIDGNTGRVLFGGRASAKVASDFQNPSDGRVYGTKYNEKDIDAYLGVNRSWGFAHVRFSLYDNQQEIPDGSRDILSRKFTYQTDEADSIRPIVPDAVLNSYSIATLHQRVQFMRVYGAGSMKIGNGRLTTKFGLESSTRREYSHPLYAAIPGLYLLLTTMPFDLKFHLPEHQGWEGTVGVNGMLQMNRASKGTEFLIPDYRNFDIGPFVHVKKRIGKVDVSGGMRYDMRAFKSEVMYTRPNPTTGFEMSTPEAPNDTTVEKQFSAVAHTFSGVSGSAGMAWSISERATLKANIGRGYRAPGVAESTSRGVHPGMGLMQLGDADLKPEFNVQEDLGFFYSGTHVSASAEVFHNLVDNYIYNEKLAALGGGDSLYVEGGREYPAFKFTQSSARLYGGELSVDIHPHPLDRLHFENSLSLVFARNEGGNGVVITDSTRYLPLIPPVRVNSGLRYGLRKRIGCLANGFIKCGVQVYMAQDRFYGAYGTETRTPSYTLLDAGLGADVVSRSGQTLFTFSVLGSNLADVVYQSNMDRLKYMGNLPGDRNGVGGIHAMGRNVSIRIVVPFSLKKEHAKSS